MSIRHNDKVYGRNTSQINDGSTETNETWSGDYLSTKFSEVNSNLPN